MKLDEFHYHEMIDRIYVVQCIIEEHLLNHPVATEDSDTHELISDAQDLLSVAYQRCGRKEHEQFPIDNGGSEQDGRKEKKDGACT